MMVMNMDTIEAEGSGEGDTVSGVQAGEDGGCDKAGGDPDSQPGGTLQSLAIFLSVYLETVINMYDTKATFDSLLIP